MDDGERQIQKSLITFGTLLLKSDKLIADEASPSSFTSIISKINSYLAYLEILLIKLTNSLKDSVKIEFENAAKEQHIKKAEFDSKLAEYLKWYNVASTEISATLSVPRMLRSQASVSITTTLSFEIAQAIAQEEMTKLKISHIDEQLTLDREEAQHKFQ